MNTPNFESLATKEFVKEEIFITKEFVKDEIFATKQFVKDEIFATKEFVKEEIFSTKALVKDVEHRLELKIEQAKVDLSKSIYMAGVIQYLAMAGTIIGIV